MLRIIKGAFNSSRDSVFSSAVAKAIESDKQVLVIVPDQYSFENEKKLYSALGAAAFNSIETAGFNRLAELISRKYGKCAAENADENIRLIAMFRAVEQFRASKECLYYKRSLTKGRFIGELISLVTDLIRSGISPDDLRIASERLEGTVAQKLYDVSKIYELYLSQLEASGLRDSLTALADALEVAKDNSCFVNMSIFLDGFTDLSYDELGFVDAMLAQHADVTVSLLGYRRSAELNLDFPFAATVRTETALLQLAKAHNTKFEVTELDDITGAGDTTLAIDRYFCCGMTADKEQAGGLKLVSANDIYDELEYVCAEIEALAANKGYSYSEIAVAARDLQVCASAAEAAFSRCEIPYFVDRQMRADSSIVVIFLKNLFECLLSKEYRTDRLLRYVKSPLFPLNDIEVTNLEDYCITYNVNGDMWLEPFGSHGMKGVPSNLEDIRRRIIEPLERFKNASADASAKAICQGLFELLNEIRFSDQVYSVVKRSAGSDNETQLEFVRSNRQIWQSVFGAVKTIHDEMNDEPISLKRFYELFKLMTSKMKIASPPQKLDAVRIVDAESSRLDNVKVLFVIELNERVFPADPQNRGLFTEREKQMMINAKLPFSATAMHSVENERLVVYRTLCLPKERLYAVYSETDTSGKSRRSSVLINKLSDIFGGIETLSVSKLPLDYFCTSFKTAYYKYLEHSKELLVKLSKNGIEEKQAQDNVLTDRADTLAAIGQALNSSEDYASRLAALPSYAYDTAFSISPETARQMFFPDKLILAPTTINKYYTCPFQFFMSRGMHLSAPRAIGFDPITKGNYLHRSLEAVMTKEESGERVYNKSFVCYTDEQLQEKISQAFNVFEAEELGGDYGKSATFAAQRDKYEQTVLGYVKLIQQEFSNSRFEPAFFEYKLTNEDGESLLEIKLSDELTVKIVGSIDRADVYTAPSGKKYFRVVDYKTGETAFDLEKLYHGLNLQMLIYLLALTDSDKHTVPAAVLYAHFKEAKVALTPPLPGEEAKTYEERLKAFKPDGMMIDDDNVMKAFNTENGGAFMPVRLNKDGSVSKTGSQPVEQSFLEAAEEFARRKIISMAEKLSKGCVPAEPVMSSYNPCTNCDHYDICGRVLHGDPEQIDKSDAGRFTEQVNDIMKEKKGESSND